MQTQANKLYAQFSEVAPYLQDTGFEEGWLRTREERAWARELIDVLDALEDGNLADADPSALEHVARAVMDDAATVLEDGCAEIREYGERNMAAAEMVLDWVTMTEGGW